MPLLLSSVFADIPSGMPTPALTVSEVEPLRGHVCAPALGCHDPNALYRLAYRLARPRSAKSINPGNIVNNPAAIRIDRLVHTSARGRRRHLTIARATLVGDCTNGRGVDRSNAGGRAACPLWSAIASQNSVLVVIGCTHDTSIPCGASSSRIARQK